MNYKIKPPKESAIQLSILKYLKAIGAVCGKTKTMGVKYGKIYRYDPYTFLGFPDITCFWNRHLYFIEVKAGKNVQSHEQKIFEIMCNKAGITYILAYSVSDVSAIIK